MIYLYIFLYIILFLIILCGFLLFCPFSVIISTDGHFVELKIKILHILFNIPITKADRNKAKKTIEKEIAEDENTIMENFLEMRNSFVRHKKSLGAALKYLRQKVDILETGVVGEFGTGNAATTGIAYGSIAAFVNMITAFLGGFLNFEKPPLVNIDLNYDKPIFNMKFVCVTRSKIFYLIRGFYIYKKYLKIYRLSE